MCRIENETFMAKNKQKYDILVTHSFGFKSSGVNNRNEI